MTEVSTTTNALANYKGQYVFLRALPNTVWIALGSRVLVPGEPSNGMEIGTTADQEFYIDPTEPTDLSYVASSATELIVLHD